MTRKCIDQGETRNTRRSHSSHFIVTYSSSTNLPLNVLDTHFLVRLLVVIEPLSLGQIDTFEFRIRLDTCGFPVALIYLSA
jgi:hypothetical protein